MAITYTQDDVTHTHGGGDPITLTSGTLTIANDDIIVVMASAEDSGGSFTGISNSGVALTWNNIASLSVASNCLVRAWWAKGDANGNRTVSVVLAGPNNAMRLHCRVHTGADTTTPVPAGNVFSAAGGSSMSQSITPTNANGSALWSVIADWNASDTIAAGASCTVDPAKYHAGGFYTEGVIRPTTQPRTNGAAFTLASTGVSQKDSWIAFEVVAAAGAAAANPSRIIQPSQAIKRASFY